MSHKANDIYADMLIDNEMKICKCCGEVAHDYEIDENGNCIYCQE